MTLKGGIIFLFSIGFFVILVERWKSDFDTEKLEEKDVRAKNG
jgi:hypothetical protein